MLCGGVCILLVGKLSRGGFVRRRPGTQQALDFYLRRRTKEGAPEGERGRTGGAEGPVFSFGGSHCDKRSGVGGVSWRRQNAKAC